MMAVTALRNVTYKPQRVDEYRKVVSLFSDPSHVSLLLLRIKTLLFQPLKHSFSVPCLRFSYSLKYVPVSASRLKSDCFGASSNLLVLASLCLL